MSAWIALYPSTLDNGAMRVIPGSHKMAQMAHRKSAEGSANMLFTHEELAADVDEAQAVDFVLEAGPSYNGDSTLLALSVDLLQAYTPTASPTLSWSVTDSPTRTVTATASQTEP